jgi:hypothetical protein
MTTHHTRRRITGLDEALTTAAYHEAPDVRQFHFTLDERPDPTWSVFFNEVQADDRTHGKLPARLNGRHIVVDCSFDALEPQLTLLKAWVATANDRFFSWQGEQALARRKKDDAALLEQMRISEAAKKLRFD